MRVVKSAVERRKEILDAADELFGQKGFDGTSTKDILDKVGIARGTLYYHFQSKEELMDALIERYSSSLIGKAREIAEDKQIPIIQRIIQVVISLNFSGASSTEIMNHIHKPQNALMHQKIQKVIINQITPVMTVIILEGIEQGLFNTPYPYQCMEMIVTYMNTVFDDDLVEMSVKDRSSRIQAYIFNAERLLGAETGSLMEVMQIFSSNE